MSALQGRGWIVVARTPTSAILRRSAGRTESVTVAAAHGRVSGTVTATETLDHDVRMPTASLSSPSSTFTPSRLAMSRLWSTNTYARRTKPGLKEVRLIHGRGTGVQRGIVQSALERHPLVAAFYDAPDSHLGATVALLIVSWFAHGAGAGVDESERSEHARQDPPADVAACSRGRRRVERQRPLLAHRAEHQRDVRGAEHEQFHGTVFAITKPMCVIR